MRQMGYETYSKVIAMRTIKGSAQVLEKPEYVAAAERVELRRRPLSA